MDHLDMCIPLKPDTHSGRKRGSANYRNGQPGGRGHRLSRMPPYQARIVLDPSYPDGTPQKLLDVSRITALGWQAQTPLPEWLKKTYDWFRRSPGLGSREATPFG